MRTITRRLDWIVLLLLPAALALVIVVDASSKSNLPPLSPLSISTNDANVVMNNSSVNDNSNNSTTMASERIRPSVTKRGKAKSSTENSESEVIARKKKKGNSSTSTNRSGSGSRSLSSPGGTSTSLRRIKREYKDAVEMGIAYDWANQRLIQRKTKNKSKNKNKTNKLAIICLGPITTNLRQWHFSFRGAGEGLYSKGIYHGQILLPKNYPLSPPSVQMWTPSGRFVPQMDICLSASNYHPESWTPRWSIQGIVNALRLHMLSSPNEIGGMQSTPDETMEYARLSLEWKKTWVTSGTKTKKNRITVDHRRLLNEGVLSDGTVLEDTEETEENGVPLTTREDTILDSGSDLDLDLNQAVAMKSNADSRYGSVNNKVDKDNSRIRFSTRYGFSSKAVALIFQLAILYMVVFLFLNR